MEFRILGSLEVAASDGFVSVAGAKQRALLAILLLHANEVVSSDRLAEALWGDQPPETASKALQVHVSQLRKALSSHASGEGLIQTRPPGYVLSLGAAELDLDRFQRLYDDARAVARSDPLRARDLIGDALALWRGPPLAEFAFEPFAQAEIGRLEELRIAAIEERVEVDLALGRHGESVGELETLVAEHPLRERLRGQLMLALYRCDRQAEALDTYRDARSALTGDLGIEPSRALRQLQEAILQQDSALDYHDSATDQPRDSADVFVGRERELAELVRALDDAVGGRGRVMLVVGEPGIGKTRLMEQLMSEARARAVSVLTGRCWEAGGAPAYWPWVQSMRAYVRDVEPAALREQLGSGAAEVAELLPELRGLLTDLPDPPPVEADGARFAVFDAVGAFLRRAAESVPLVLVFDDLHAADDPSLLLLRFVAREIAHSPVLVIGAFRDVDPAMHPSLRATVAELVREPHVRQIALSGLAEPDVGRYVELATATEAAPQLTQAIQSETRGNPLFVTEVVRWLAAEGSLSRPDAQVRIPPEVHAVIAQRVARLSPTCREILAFASVLGRGFAVDVLAQLADMRQAALLAALDEAIVERVIEEVPGAPNRLRFAHALIRDTVYEGLAPARRVSLHGAAGEALETVHAASLDAHLAELAHHYCAAARGGAPDVAVDYAARAGDRAARQHAYEEAVRLYGMALELAGDEQVRCELLLASGEAHARSGDTAGSKRIHHEAAELATSLGLPKLLARAALGYGGRLVWDVSRDDANLVPLLERALAALGQRDDSLRVRLLARLAGGPLKDPSFPPERKAALATEAVEVARRIGDPVALAHALDAYIPASESPDTTIELLELADELLALALELGDRELSASAHEHRVGRLMELGRIPEATAGVEAMRKLAGELRQPAQQWLSEVCAARLALLEGRLPEAESLIAGARAIGERTQGWNAAVAFRLQFYLLRREQGRAGEVEELVNGSVVEYPTFPLWRCVQAQMAAALGHDAQARETIEALAAHDFAALPFDAMWLVSMGFLAEAASAVGDARRAELLYARLLPYGGRIAVSYPEISTGAIARYLGLLASTQAGWDAAETHFQQARELNERIGARPWVVRTQRDHAQMLLARNAAGDAPGARPY